MADNQDPRSEAFQQAEEAFSNLELDQKARFLAQEAVGTALEGIECLMDYVIEEVDSLFADEPSPAAASQDSAETESED